MTIRMLERKIDRHVRVSTNPSRLIWMEADESQSSIARELVTIAVADVVPTASYLPLKTCIISCNWT